MTPNHTKKNTVFILGAGASKDAGVPLMAEFLDVARDIYAAKAHPTFSEDYQAVFEGINALRGVYAKSSLDLDNIESVFAVFEMAKLLGKMGDLQAEKINQLPHHMRRMIGSVVEQTTKFGWGDLPITSPQPYDGFIDMLVRTQEFGNRPSIITFNYDLGLDYALARHCFPRLHIPLDVEILKLHGSLHWFKCKNADCEHVTKIDLVQLMSDSDQYWKPKGDGKSRLELLDNEHIQKKVCDACNAQIEIDPLIIPPTWSKMQHYPLITSEWQKAAKVLGAAEHIFVCGYSLPLTDEFFRYLFALGTDSTIKIRRFCVITQNKAVEERFRTLLGASVLPRFEPWSDTFASSIGKIQNEFTR